MNIFKAIWLLTNMCISDQRNGQYCRLRCLVIGRSKNCGPNLGLMDLNEAQNEVFRYFLEFGSYVFLEIGYNDSLQQCLTSSRDKTCTIGPGSRFFAIFSDLVL